MIVRIYQYDGRVTHSLLHASCIAELQMPEEQFEQEREALLEEYGGDFFTLDEPETENDAIEAI